MGDPVTTAIGVSAGTAVLGGLLSGDSESTSTTTQNYKTTPVKLKMPSGETITVYSNVNTGSTMTQESDSDFGDILGSALTAGGEAYSFGTLLDKYGSDDLADIIKKGKFVTKGNV